MASIELSYNMPTYRCGERSLHVAAWKHGVSLYGWDEERDGGFDFEALGVMKPPDPDDHRWYAFDELRADEVIAFRTYDSDRVGTDLPYWTPHSAFRDPDVALGRPSRSSIELRATCVYV